MMLNPRSYLYTRQRLPSSSTSATATPVTTTTPTTTTTNPLPPRRRGDEPVTTRPSNAGIPSRPRTTLSKHKESGSVLSPPTTSTTMANAFARPRTPTSAVQIPVKGRSEYLWSHNHKSRRHHADSQPRQSPSSQRSRRSRHSSDAVPPAVANLLAVTSIPPQGRRGSIRQRMTVDSIVPRSQVSEKELSRELSFSSLSRSPMDVLLSPPDENPDENVSVTSDSCLTSAISTRVASLESLPSLGADSSYDTTSPLVDSPITPRGRRFQPPRRSLEPVSSPPGMQPEHPLWFDPDVESDDELELQALVPSVDEVDKPEDTVFLPLKAAFKSNLTASLRALRSAARSLSTFTASSVPPEDLLTRSILTMDPRVPFTDERRPPVLDEEPSEAMRRYLNPTDIARLDTRSSRGHSTRGYTASIQMQTYKIQRSRSAPPATSRTATAAAAAPPPPSAPAKAPAPLTFPPGPRQRDIRENSDFIRIAVLEHLMRKQGKFDNSQEGHARWLLPPRKTSSKPYEIGPDGIPARWVPVSRD